MDGYGPGAAAGIVLADLQSEFDRRLGQEDVDILSTYAPVTVNTAAVADTFGAWVQLVADVGLTPVVIVGLMIRPMNGVAGNRNFELEIGTGAAAAEVRAFGFSGRSLVETVAGYQVPLVYTCLRRIPASARLSARVRHSEAAARAYEVAPMYRLGA